MLSLSVCLTPALAEVLVVAGASLPNPDPSAPPRVVNLWVEDGKIRAIGPDVALPEPGPGVELRRIEGRGLFLCPAPIDGFAYWNEAHDPLYAASGIALLVDHGNNVLTVLDGRASTTRAGYPTLRICGPVIDGFPPSTTDASVARTPLEAEAQLRPLFEEGIDFVAFQANLGLEPWRKVIEVAHGEKKQVWGPLAAGVSLAGAVDAGQDGFLMLDVLLPAGKTWETATGGDFEAGIQKLGSAQARLVPLLSGHARLVERWKADDADLALLAPEFDSYWRGELAARAAMFPEGEARARFLEKGARALELQQSLLPRLAAAGVRLVPGSGAPHPWLFPGAGYHDELARWQKAGIPAAEVLRLATSGAAAALGLGAERGSLEAGQAADFVLLSEDPARDVRALRAPAWVVLRGTARSRAELDQGVQELRSRQASARALAARPIEVGDPPNVEGELVLAGYVESGALGVRNAAERYTVVRGKDGKLSFAGQRVVPQEDGSRIEVETLQRVAGRELEYFLVRVRSAKHEISAEGFWTANQFRVQRRLDGVHLDLSTTPERVALVDVGSVTAPLVLAATRDEGTFPVMAFHETLQLEVVRWNLTLEGDGAHYLRTPEGVKWARFDPRGALAEYSEQRGTWGVRTTGTNTLAKDRPGLPFSAAKRAAIEAARARANAAEPPAKSAPEKPSAEPPAKGAGGERER